jgi:hypothetical protein
MANPDIMAVFVALCHFIPLRQVVSNPAKKHNRLISEILGLSVASQMIKPTTITI